MSARTDLSHWQKLFGNSNDAKLAYEHLLLMYSEPHRYYHNLTHIEECLLKFDQVSSRCDRPKEVEIAIWCHDVIYDPKKSDNEEKSAEWTEEVLSKVSWDHESIQRVFNLVVATKTHDSSSEDSKILNDIDLSILAAPKHRFLEYCDQIRNEYNHVPEDLYNMGRGKILLDFYNREKIFLTEAFQKDEILAKENLKREIDLLS